MISFQKILLGFFAGSMVLIFAVTRLFSPVDQVSAFAEDNIDEEITTNVDEQIIQNTCSISQTYPDPIQQWCQLIEINALYYSIDPNFIAAVMLQESGGDSNAYSHSGAVGLMQIMPRDGIAADFVCVNGPCFSNRPTMDELFDPQFNIEFGTRMLANLFEKYGNWRDALKAYGPMDMGYGYADIVMNIYQSY